MATKKNNALAKKQTTALANWDAELAKYATETADKEQMPTGNFVSIRGGIMSIAGQPIKDNKVQVVIIDHVYENAKYSGDFDPETPQPPECYAFGREEKELAPHADSSNPQHDGCAGCPMNVFGSADKGKGKACKNTRRLALISADGLSADSVLNGELVYMKLPVTSTKGWAFYVKGLSATLKRPPFAVITEIAVVPDPKTQIKVTFSPIGNVPNDVMGAVMQRREKVMGEIMFPYGKPSEDVKPAKGKAKGKPAPKARKF